jgi:hypothetical protein
VQRKKNGNKRNLTETEKRLLLQIRVETNKLNLDNISRTLAYLNFYLKYPEITWTFLASMVSRNGGYNMCDLEGEWFPRIVDLPARQGLFLTYERANWTIFHDAYPQLLLYHYSTKMGQPLFHLLRETDVSLFMEEEWNYFWKVRDRKRLMVALIVNEQNVIDKTVIELDVYRKKVFNTMRFLFQDLFHFSAVLLPTTKGELYGASVNGFKSLNKRINLGKRLAAILFNQELYPLFLEFALKTEHTGSRYDYEQYFPLKKKRDTPFLRCTYPVINHHYRRQPDWYRRKRFHDHWMNTHIHHKHSIHLTKWFLHKQKQYHTLISLIALGKTAIK